MGRSFMGRSSVGRPLIGHPEGGGVIVAAGWATTTGHDYGGAFRSTHMPRAVATA